MRTANDLQIRLQRTKVERDTALTENENVRLAMVRLEQDAAQIRPLMAQLEQEAAHVVALMARNQELEMALAEANAARVSRSKVCHVASSLV